MQAVHTCFFVQYLTRRFLCVWAWNARWVDDQDGFARYVLPVVAPPPLGSLLHIGAYVRYVFSWVFLAGSDREMLFLFV